MIMITAVKYIMFKIKFMSIPKHSACTKNKPTIQNPLRYKYLSIYLSRYLDNCIIILIDFLYVIGRN